MALVLTAGCAECGVEEGESLIDLVEFESEESAREWISKQDWLFSPLTPHPQGGEHSVSSSGSVWLLPEDMEGFFANIEASQR
jgi:hypothetical protein